MMPFLQKYIPGNPTIVNEFMPGGGVSGAPSILPPGVPRDRVKILQEAFHKAYLDPAFQKEYKKLVGDDPSPLLPEDHEKVIREISREPEVIDLFIAGAGPVPPG